MKTKNEIFQHLTADQQARFGQYLFRAHWTANKMKADDHQLSRAIASEIEHMEIIADVHGLTRLGQAVHGLAAERYVREAIRRVNGNRV